MYQPRLRKQRNGIPVMSNSEIDIHAEDGLHISVSLRTDIRQNGMRQV